MLVLCDLQNHMALEGDGFKMEQDYLPIVIDVSIEATPPEEIVTVETPNSNMKIEFDDKLQGEYKNCVIVEDIDYENQKIHNVRNSFNPSNEINGDKYESQNAKETCVFTEEINSEDPLEHDVSDMLETEQTHFSWTHETTLLMLEGYYKLIEEFKDPTIRNSIPWSKIENTFFEHGFVITKEGLSTKFRNLKKTFYNIHELKSKKAKRGNITWPYFTHFLNILENDPNFFNNVIKKSKRIHHQASVLTPTMARPLNIVPFTLYRVTPANDSITSAPSTRSIHPSEAVNNIIPTPYSISPNKKFATRSKPFSRRRVSLMQKKKVKHANSQEITIRKRRSIEIQKLIKEIQQNNIIQRERNCLLKELLSLI